MDIKIEMLRALVTATNSMRYNPNIDPQMVGLYEERLTNLRDAIIQWRIEREEPMDGESVTIEKTIADAREVVEGCPEKGSKCAYQHNKLAEWLEELKAYRETGLMPEDIANFMENYKTAISQFADYLALGTVETVMKWSFAESAGRLVELPCKVDACVWVISAYGNQYATPLEGYVSKFVLHDDKLMYLEVLIWVDLGEGKKEYGFDTDGFGKIIFLTREAAEAALKEQEG